MILLARVVTLPCSDVMALACVATLLFNDLIVAAWLLSVFCKALTALARLFSEGVEAEAAAGASSSETQGDNDENDELAHDTPSDPDRVGAPAVNVGGAPKLKRV